MKNSIHLRNRVSHVWIEGAEKTTDPVSQAGVEVVEDDLRLVRCRFPVVKNVTAIYYIGYLEECRWPFWKHRDDQPGEQRPQHTRQRTSENNRMVEHTIRILHWRRVGDDLYHRTSSG